MKVFRDKPLQPQPAVANEVLGFAMAELFELPTPQAALIEFTQEFIETLAPQQLEQLGTAQVGLKYGCRYIETPHRFSPALAKRYLAGYDMASIYAFDNLILNRDRDAIKPNMLLVGQEAYLIDHEISIVGAEYAQRELEQGNWTYQYQEHVFFNYLRANQLEDINKIFDTFIWYLQNTNFDELLPYCEQLIELGFDIDHFAPFYRYLCYQNSNSSRFEDILKRTLL